MDWQRLIKHYASGMGGFEDYCADQLRIIPKGGGEVIPLNLNRHQRHVLACMEEQLQQRRMTRLIILKSRRIGMSTLSLAWIYYQTTLFHHMNSLIMAHNDESTQQLWRFVQIFQKHISPKLIPATTTESTHALAWHATDSALRLATAGSRAGGRGSTRQNLLLSEVAFYPANVSWQANWLPTVNTEPFTSIIVESTAFGQGGPFHGFWIAANKNEVDYLPIFLPWHWGGDNRVSEDEFELRHRGLLYTQEEQELANTHDLDKYQIAWRRDEMHRLEQASTDGGDPFDLFHQEHPSTPEEAFLFSGMPVFNQQKLLLAKKHQRKPIGRFEISADPDKLRVERADRGRLTIWQFPNPDHAYGIGADVAEGLAHGDNSAAYVKDFTTGEIVASWVSNDADPDLFGHYLNNLGRLYAFQRPGVVRRRPAQLAVERNGPGAETISTLIRLNYPMLWISEDPSAPSDDKQKPRGFRTTTASKPYLIAQLRAELREHPQGIVDPMLISEMGTFVRVPQPTRRDKPGRMEAAPGNKDDRVIAAALASLVYRESTGKTLATAEEKDAVVRAADTKAKQELGKKIYNQFFRSKSSSPAWDRKQAAKQVKKDATPKTLDDVRKVLEQLVNDKPIKGGNDGDQ